MIDELKFETLIGVMGSVFEGEQDTRASNKQYSLSEPRNWIYCVTDSEKVKYL